ncbi:hypothetical protein IWW38_005873, partial [Coemansia aciculifera]
MTVLPTKSDSNILSDRQQARLGEIEQEFAVSDDQLQAIVKRIHAELFQGLDKTHGGSLLAMSPSFVHQNTTTPSGTALGMGIEASGRRIRITRADFYPTTAAPPRALTQVFVTPPAVLKNNSVAFFEHTAYCLREFIQAQGDLDHKEESFYLPLGISIGLPIGTSGEEVKVDEGFSEQPKEDSLDLLCGKNVARKLCDTFLRARLPVRVASVTNSAVSIL